MTAKRLRDAFVGMAKSLVQSFSAVVCAWAEAASGSCFDRDIRHFDGRAVRGAPGVARAV